jgi:PAS domain S-box-containing protein
MPTRYPFEDLVDVQALQQLTDDLYTATGIPSAIIDMNGKVVTGSGWQRICTDFHRKHPDIERDCIESDIAIRKGIDDGEDFVIYQCPRGLVDACSPVVIEGEHVANVFAGQLFMTPPNATKESFFRESARKYGLDEEAYLAAYLEIPVLPEEKFRPALRFLARFAKLVAGIGLARIREIESAYRHESIIRTAMDGFWVTDLNGRILQVNDTYCRMSGYTEQELLRLSVSDVDAEESAEAAAAHIQKVIRLGYDRFESRHRRKDGALIDVEVSVQVQRWDSGLLVVFVRDITEKKKLEAQRSEMESRLRQAQKMEAIGTLAGGIAHDFNNILSAILGYTELTLSSLPPGSEGRENLQEVMVASNRAKELVKQILNFSRAGEERRKPVEPARIVLEALNLLRSTIPKTIEFVQRIDPDTGYILADPSQVHQLVMNLCANSYHAMREKGGTLEVRIERSEVGTEEAARVEGLRPGSYAKIVVTDTGTGMDRLTLGRIFEPYFTTKGLGEGTGLGLSVVLGIVKNHGGAISVSSAPGVGTVFTVYLPLQNEAPTSHDLPKATILGGRESILFVDDEPAIARLGQKLLESLGYTVREMTDPRDALRLFESDPEGFDILVTDQTMPGLTGSDLVLRARSIRPGLPAVICTGYSDMLDEAGAKIIGVPGFAMKPYNRATLATVVRKALEEARSSTTALPSSSPELSDRP